MLCRFQLEHIDVECFLLFGPVTGYCQRVPVCSSADARCICNQLSVCIFGGKLRFPRKIMSRHPPCEVLLCREDKGICRSFINILKSQCCETQCWNSHVCRRPGGNSFSVAAKIRSNICAACWSSIDWISSVLL